MGLHDIAGRASQVHGRTPVYATLVHRCTLTR